MMKLKINLTSVMGGKKHYKEEIGASQILKKRNHLKASKYIAVCLLVIFIPKTKNSKNKDRNLIQIHMRILPDETNFLENIDSDFITAI